MNAVCSTKRQLHEDLNASKYVKSWCCSDTHTESELLLSKVNRRFVLAQTVLSCNGVTVGGVEVLLFFIKHNVTPDKERC